MLKPPIWSVDKGENVEPFTPTRPQDKIFVGNILESMVAYAKGIQWLIPHTAAT